MLEGATEIIALADGLRGPLLRLHANSQSVHDARDVQVITEHALRDIEAFITTYTLNSDAQSALVPMALSSLLLDVSEKVKPYAKLAGTSLLIDDHTSHQLVSANPPLLSTGLEMITKTICDLDSDLVNPSVVMRADTRHGYPRLGVYRDDIDLSAEDLHMAQKLIGGAQVNAGMFQQLGALRVLIVSRLLEPLGLKLRTAKSNGDRGLALQLQPTTQASLFGV